MPARHQLLLQRYHAVRHQTMELVAGLSPEDCLLQSMADASPVKWHLAHSSWFFETFVLAAAEPLRPAFDASFALLFNSYYTALGERLPRAARGLLSRPALDTVFAYRQHVDEAVERVLSGSAVGEELLQRVELGLHHEQQHQELILTDLKHHLWSNPLHPAYRRSATALRFEAPPLTFATGPHGYARIGHQQADFAFDNEQPAHGVWLEPFELAQRLVTNAEYAAFIADGGYQRPELWLADGWDLQQRERWSAPLYWAAPDAATGHPESVFTLTGDQAWQAAEPVCHVSYYEADAFARWAGARLPTEAEWEAMLRRHGPGISGALLEDGPLHPQPAADGGLCQMLGDVWEWTGSAYLPYPGFRPWSGVVGEYNGKFMSNQMVLRGGSCATPASHLRASYRNFFPPAARWQFSGLRLARSLD